MDTSIKLRHKATEQECVFDDESAVDEFLANVEKPSDWAAPGVFAAKVVDVNLPELHAQLAAEKLDEARAAVGLDVPAPKAAAKPRAKK